jgi:spore coat polysaccharide biosynthesis protein SpsF
LAIAVKVGIVILARYNSSRLPGKALKTIAGKPVLLYIVERIKTVVPLGDIILATSQNKSDDILAEFAQEQGIACHRGSLEKVALRFYEAAQQLNCQYACRINGDNIFLDPALLKAMVKQAQKNEHPFLSNVKGRTYPKGMSVEIVAMAYYQKHLATILSSAYYTEHVMVYLYELAAADAHFYLKNTTLPEAAGLQLALDTAQDFERSQWIINNLNVPHTQAGLSQIVALSKAYEQQAKTENT